MMTETDFKLPEDDARLALQYAEDTDMARFRLGKLVGARVEHYSDHGVPVGQIYSEFSRATRGLSVRTLRYYAETVKHFSESAWEEYCTLSFDHFANAAFLARNGLVPMAKFALDWALEFAEKKGKGNPATADEMLYNFLPQEELEKRLLRSRLSAFRTLRKAFDRLPEDLRKEAERLLSEIEEILNGYKPEPKPEPEALGQIIEEIMEKAGAKRVAQDHGVTLYQINEAPEVPEDVKMPGYRTVSGIRDKAAALTWGARNHYTDVLWLAGRQRVYVLGVSK